MKILSGMGCTMEDEVVIKGFKSSLLFTVAMQHCNLMH